MAARDPHETLWEALPHGLAPPYMGARLRFLLAQVPHGTRVLDVGCGEGRFASALREAGREVVAIDVAEEALRRARDRDRALDVRLVRSDSAWPLEDASFDAVWAGEVIEHVADTAGWLSEVRRVLRPQGVLVLSTPAHDPLARLALGLSARAFEAHFDPLSDHLRFYTRRALLALLREFRFEPLRADAIGGFPGARRVLLACARRLRF